MVAERRSIALKSLSDESVERVVQCVDSSENEEMMTTEDTVGYTPECRPEMVREPDYLKFLAEVEKEAVDPEQFLDMNDEDDFGRDQEAGMAPEFSDEVAAESSGNAAANLVIRFGSHSSNEPLWTESDLEDCMKRCKEDWSDEEQGELTGGVAQNAA